MRARLERLLTVPGAVVLTLIGHLLFIDTAIGTDEGGFAMVARHAGESGPVLYGPQFVDRPPDLLWWFDLANHLGRYGERVVATGLACVLTLACAWAGLRVAGDTGARWSAWIAGALGSSVFLLAEQLNGELIAATLVAVAFGSGLEARRRRGTRAALAFGVLCGVAGAAAMLSKQNFIDGLAFGVVLLGSAATLERGREAWTVCAAQLLGAAAALGAAVLWSLHHHGVGALVYAMYGVRLDANQMIADVSSYSPAANVGRMLAFGALAGAIPLLVVVLFAWGPHAVRRSPVGWALGVALAVEVLGVAAGGSYWPHYLIALIPTVSLLAAAAIAHREVGAAARTSIVVVAIACVTSTVVSDPVYAVAVRRTVSPDMAVSRWIARAAAPNDTIAVPFTHANVIGLSGLRPVYPYSWPLLVRTLDPDLSLFLATLDGSHPPTWVVRWDEDPDTVGLDRAGRMTSALDTRYRLVGTLCGHQIWLLRGHHARVGLTPRDCS